MKSTILFFAGVIFLSLATTTEAQVATSYTFSQDSVNYDTMTINGGVVLSSLTEFTNQGPYNNLDIGFAFRFNEIDYNKFSVCGKGFIGLGSSVSANTGALSSGSTNNVIAAFSVEDNGDLIGIGSFGAELRYQTLGVSPNRILVVQWTKYAKNNSAQLIPEDAYNFQLRLYETTNAIKIVYGTMINGPASANVQVGLRGPNSNDFNNRRITDTVSWSHTKTGDKNTSACAISAAKTPISGLTFTWKPKLMPFTYSSLYSSFTTKQADTLDVGRGSMNTPIISFQIAVAGNSGTPIFLDSVMLNNSGTTNFVRDIKNVKIYFTGTKNTFDTTTLYGSATNIFSPIPGNVALIGGGNSNYFWVTYDIATNAIVGDFIDAQCISISLRDSGIKTPLVSNPAGKRIISQWFSKKGLDVSGYPIGFSIGKKGYVCFGTINGSPSKELWEYEPDSNKWMPINEFPGAYRYNAVGFSIGGKGYVGLGTNNVAFENVNDSNSTDFWEYDPQNNSWREVAPFLGAGRYGAFGFSIGGKGYVGTGVSDTWSKINGFTYTYYKDFYEYDPTKGVKGEWKKMADVPCQNQGRYGAFGFSIGSKGYVGGGMVNTNIDKTFYEYTPSTDSKPDKWRSVTSYPCANSPGFNISFSIRQNGYVGGNCGWGNKGQARFWKYDLIQTDTTDPGDWTEVNNLPALPRSQAVGFSINDVGYVGFGMCDCSGAPAMNDFFALNPLSHPPTAEFLSGVDTICSGESIILFDQSTNSPTSWNWYFQGGTPSNSTVQNPTITYNSVGAHNVSLIVENNDGIDTLIKENFIVVKQSPQINTAGDITICPADTAKLVAVGMNVKTYRWIPPAGLSCTDCDTTYAHPQNTTKYIVIGTSENGCEARDSVWVYVSSKVVANAGHDVGICKGGKVQLHASGGTNCSWNPIKGLSNPLIYNPDATPDSTTTYTVIVSSGSCSKDSAMVMVTVRPNPSIPTITQNGNTLQSDSAKSYQWYRNDTLIANATSQIFTVTKDGDYTVVVTDSNGCSARSASKRVTVGVRDEKLALHFILAQNYPNPFTHLSVVSCQLSGNGKGIFEVRDMMGRIVQHLSIDSDTKQITIDASGLSNGMYLYSLNDGKNIQSRTMMVMK